MRRSRGTRRRVETVITNPLLRYIGIMTAAEAEEVVTRPTTFRLYHQTSMTLEEMRKALHNNLPEAVTPTVPLFVMYRSRTGQPRHYRIKENDTVPIPTYSVDVPNVSQPCFFSIVGLVRFYRYVSV
ncbi:hypothetical protein COOONC_07782 [Cooperia oncophora]